MLLVGFPIPDITWYHDVSSVSLSYEDLTDEIHRLGCQNTIE